MNIKRIILFVISILPIILIGTYIYKKDKNKEPKKLLLELFVLGILSTIVVFFISKFSGSFIPILNTDTTKSFNNIELIIYTFVGIGFIEELSKWIIIYIFSYNNKEFDEYFDIIVYSVFVALGFACFENIVYVLNSESMSIAIFRAFLSVPGHVCNAIFMGYYLGLAKYYEINNNSIKRYKNEIFSLFIPVIIHGTFDFLLYKEKMILLIVFFILIINLYVLAMKSLNKVLQNNMKIKSL